MFRELIIRRGMSGNSVFTRRGNEVSRIEGFSDAAFGFAITLLITSQQVPKSYQDLLETMRGFYAFAFCFAILITLWYRHYQFFRHYGLQDGFTVFLNAVLLFVVLFFVFPLKFIITAVFDHLMGRHPEMQATDLPAAFQFYFFGLATVCLVFTLLYYNAYHRREELELSPLEVCETQISMAQQAFPMTICLLSSLFLWLARRHATTSWSVLLAGLTLLLIPLYHTAIRRWRKATHARLKP